ncbi:glycosyltransferase family 2 protein [Rubrobacter indicoceani]|uniref:glycosyltransferase family 2 protein n=1 Tax=Rubrobacter indicoceani TaxID=2051957 RepID=UPI0013C4CD3B|nr:glycosyltransferase [Rubrobacter indicoceani]
MNPIRTVAVVPARNEAGRIGETLASLANLPGLAHFVVVDDASVDATGEVAGSLGAEVVRTTGENGKGGAMLSGLTRARRRVPDAILLCDADLGATAAGLSALLEALTTESPVAIAAFPASVAGGGGFGTVKRLARKSIAARTGFSPVEPLSGQRALFAGPLYGLPGVAPGFGAEVGMTLDLLEAGITPAEIPVELSHRATGKSLRGFSHRARQGCDVLRALRGDRLRWP